MQAPRCLTPALLLTAIIAMSSHLFSPVAPPTMEPPTPPPARQWPAHIQQMKRMLREADNLATCDHSTDPFSLKLLP